VLPCKLTEVLQYWQVLDIILETDIISYTFLTDHTRDLVQSNNQARHWLIEGS